MFNVDDVELVLIEPPEEFNFRCIDLWSNRLCSFGQNGFVMATLVESSILDMHVVTKMPRNHFSSAIPATSDGSCVDLRVDSKYWHTNIQSCQPTFSDACLLFCCGNYACIVVMSAMQLSVLYTLASNAQPNWFADISIFTHASLKQEVVLGVTISGAVTVWTLNGSETLNATIYEHESRVVRTLSPIVEIHCCQQLPRLVLLVCQNEWRILDAIDCSCLTWQATPRPDVQLIGGNFIHKEFIVIYTSTGEARVIRLPKDVLTKTGQHQIERSSTKPRLVAKIKLDDWPDGLEGSVSRGSFICLPVTKTSKGTFALLGSQPKVVAGVMFGRADGSLHAWSLASDQLVSSTGSSCVDLEPFLRTSLSDLWGHLDQGLFGVPSEPPQSPPPASAVTAKEVITCAISVFSIGAAYSTNSAVTPTAASLPPRLVLGTMSGDLVVTPLHGLLESLFVSPTSTAATMQFRLSGHTGAVLCLLHPYSLNSGAFRSNQIVSGSADYSVRVWDLDPLPQASSCVAVFYSHPAPVISLSVGPPSSPLPPKSQTASAVGKASFLSSCLASVAADGSVSVFSPQDRYVLLRCRTGAGGHSCAQVYSISWRLAEMMLFVLSEAGDLSIWDLASGHLERHETGEMAAEIFLTGSYALLVSSNPSPLPLDYRGSQNSANQSAAASSIAHHTARAVLTQRSRLDDRTGFLAPLLLQTIGSCGPAQSSPAAFVFHFDVEALILGLLDGAAIGVDGNSGDHADANVPLSLEDCGKLLRLLLSLTYPFGVDSPEVEDQLCHVLQLNGRPNDRGSPCSGCVSNFGYLTLSMPAQGSAISNSSSAPRISTNVCLAQVSLAEAICSTPLQRLKVAFPATTKSSAMSSFHATNISTMAALLACSIWRKLQQENKDYLSLCSLVPHWQAKCLQIRYAARTLAYAKFDNMPANQRAAFMNQLARFLPANPVAPRNSDTLASTNLSPTNVNVLPPPLNGSTETLTSPIDRKASSSKAVGPVALECCESAELLHFAHGIGCGVFDTFAFGPKRLLPGAATFRYRAFTFAIISLGTMGTRCCSSYLGPDVAARDLCPDANDCAENQTNRRSVGRIESQASSSSSIAVAFGSPRGITEPYYGSHASTPTLSKTEEAFVLGVDVDITRKTATCLKAILDLDLTDDPRPAESVVAQSPLLQPYAASAVRRAAVDLLGRGFVHWEPYVDTAQLLTSLLSLAADAETHLANFKPTAGVLSDSADLARTARQSLWQLTYSRPQLVVLNLSLMIRRLGANAMSAMVTAAAIDGGGSSTDNGAANENHAPILRVVMSSPALAAPFFTSMTNPQKQQRIRNDSPQRHSPTPSQLAPTTSFYSSGVPQQQPTNQTVIPLLRAKNEVLRLFEDIIERRPNDLTPILPELVEVVLACVDRTRLKDRGLFATFPALQRFNSVGSHTRAQKVCVGGTNGMLIFFDFKNGRYFSTHAHQAPITAVCFNGDGRQLASYSIGENVLKTWQLSTTGLFGMGGQQVRILLTYPIRPLQPPPSSSSSSSSSAAATTTTAASAGSMPQLNPNFIFLNWSEVACVRIMHRRDCSFGEAVEARRVPL